MLQDLRDQKNSWLIILLFAIIIIVFIFMFGLPGMDSVISKNHSNPATVASHDITHDMLRSMIYQMYDDKVFGTAQYPSIAYAMTESLATIYLLADDARQAGLRVSDDELQDYLTNWESGNSDILRFGFLKQNQFSKSNYNDALNRMMMSAGTYEDYKRNELLARRYLTLMISSISVSEETLWQHYAMENATASLDYIRLTPQAVRATFKDVTDEEVTAFKASNAADIETYYNEHLGQYTTPPKAKLHQIVIQKNLLKLTNPGEKTVKSYQPEQRFSIARAQVVEKGLDFAQAYTDYDESEDKAMKGITGLLGVDIMATELQTALEGKKVGDVITAELSDRFIIAKVLEETEKVVTPLDEVKDSIARQLIDERRVAARTETTVKDVIAKVQGGQSLADALNESLYSDVLAEQPVVVVPVEVPEIHADPNDPNSPIVEMEPMNPVVVPVETDKIIIPESSRVQVKNVSDTTIDTGFISGLGVNEDLARDIRSASVGTLLAQSYTIGLDTILVRVVDKKEASRENFDAQKVEQREKAIAEKVAQLIGNVDQIIGLQGGRGVWLEQKLETAKTSGRFNLNMKYFAAPKKANPEDATH